MPPEALVAGDAYASGTPASGPEAGTTVLVRREPFRAPPVPPLGGMLGPTRGGFEAMSTALRERAEQTPAAR